MGTSATKRTVTELLNERAHEFLLNHAGEKDFEEFATLLFHLVAGPLTNYMRRLGVDCYDDREDMLQEVMDRFFKKVDTFKKAHTQTSDCDSSAIYSYLCTVARNLIIDRRRSRDCRIKETPYIEVVHDSREALNQNEFDRQLDDAIKSLPEEEWRESALHYWVQERTLNEVAVLLGLDKATVKKYVQRSKPYLAKAFWPHRRVKPLSKKSPKGGS